MYDLGVTHHYLSLQDYVVGFFEYEINFLDQKMIYIIYSTFLDITLMMAYAK